MAWPDASAAASSGAAATTVRQPCEPRAMAMSSPSHGLVVNDQGDRLRAVAGRRPGSFRRVEAAQAPPRGDGHVRDRVGTHERHLAGMLRARHDGPS